MNSKLFRWIAFAVCVLLAIIALIVHTATGFLCFAVAAFITIPINRIFGKLDSDLDAKYRKRATFITTIIFFLCGLFAFTTAGSSSAKENSNQAITTTTAITTEVTTTTIPTTISTTTVSTTTETTTQLTEPESEPIVFPTDLSIITAPGHPTYYGSMSQAQEIWANVEDGKIDFVDPYFSSSKLILSIKRCPRQNLYSREKSDVIGELNIYFSNFEDSNYFSLSDALSIISDYIPYDIMKQYYEFYESYCLQPTEKCASEETYYVIKYNLNEEGKSIYEKEHSYFGNVSIICEVNPDGGVNLGRIMFDTPGWMLHYELNSFDLLEWHCDLLESK